eukprot:Seg835.1 transcript_id=Seg835.1/GoldUCD/mRNA.D3Y31 product="hypothetical protein" protein_id=Seg835.1/GoldUCD/D3Y31
MVGMGSKIRDFWNESAGHISLLLRRRYFRLMGTRLNFSSPVSRKMAAVRALGLFRIGYGNCLTRLSQRQKIVPKLWQSCCSQIKSNNRRISTTSFILANESKDAEKEIKEPATWFSNLLGYGDEENEGQLISGEEMEQREALFAEIADMYFAKPRQYPDLKFIEKVVDFLIKHNDDHGVKTVWLIMQDMKLEPSEELIVKMENFISKAREESWFK